MTQIQNRTHFKNPILRLKTASGLALLLATVVACGHRSQQAAEEPSSADHRSEWAQFAQGASAGDKAAQGRISPSVSALAGGATPGRFKNAEKKKVEPPAEQPQASADLLFPIRK